MSGKVVYSKQNVSDLSREISMRRLNSAVRLYQHDSMIFNERLAAHTERLARDWQGSIDIQVAAVFERISLNNPSCILFWIITLPNRNTLGRLKLVRPKNFETVVPRLVVPPAPKHIQPVNRVYKVRDGKGNLLGMSDDSRLMEDLGFVYE